MTVAPERIETRLDEAIERATSRLLELQHPGGWWVGELESNATMIAQHLFWHHVLGLRTPEPRPQDRERAAGAAARRRHLVDLVRGARRPLDLGRGLRGAQARRRRPGRQGTRLHPQRGRDPEDADLHEVLPRAPRPVALAANRPDPRRARAAPAERAALDLQLLVLGPRHLRPALGLPGAPARARRRTRPARDRLAARRASRTPHALADEADRRSRKPNAGSGSTRRPTARGAGSSRRGSGRS